MFLGRTYEEVVEMEDFQLWGIEATDAINKGEFSDVTVDVLRERITTFNNLIVRLPVSTKHNCLASKRIFQDWRAFVDGAVEHLVGRGELKLSEMMTGIGSDRKKYTFNEYLTKDGKPLVDYSWLYASDPMNPYMEEDGITPIGDRFDYWRDGTLPAEEGEGSPRDDFKWPQ